MSTCLHIVILRFPEGSPFPFRTSTIPLFVRNDTHPTPFLASSLRLRARLAANCSSRRLCDSLARGTTRSLPHWSADRAKSRIERNSAHIHPLRHPRTGGRLPTGSLESRPRRSPARSSSCCCQRTHHRPSARSTTKHNGERSASHSAPDSRFYSATESGAESTSHSTSHSTNDSGSHSTSRSRGRSASHSRFHPASRSMTHPWIHSTSRCRIHSRNHSTIHSGSQSVSHWGSHSPSDSGNAHVSALAVSLAVTAICCTDWSGRCNLLN